ncbi:hypothetical protein B9D94_28950 [Paenibacillus sp. Cedars]|nr:hypothetical protein B9D94_28950 [Paenibacillus sp. Cedars]
MTAKNGSDKKDVEACRSNGGRCYGDTFVPLEVGSGGIFVLTERQCFPIACYNYGAYQFEKTGIEVIRKAFQQRGSEL